MTTKVVTDEQLGNLARRQSDLFGRVSKGVVDFRSTMDGLQLLIEGKSAQVGRGINFSSILTDWEKYYLEIHGLKVDFSGFKIPEAEDNFSWLICRPEKFFVKRAFSGGKQLYPRWKYTKKSLDDVLDMSFGRDGKVEPYIVRVRPNWEADEDLKNLSANQIAESKTDTLCLTERLLLGDFLYWKHRKHLDVDTVTLCSGSRFSVGLVPFVDWSGIRMRVDWYDTDVAGGVLRSRQQFS